MVGQGPLSQAPSPRRREGGCSQHAWTGITGSPGLGELQVGPGRGQQMSSQLSTTALALLSVLKKWGALGREG